jgi:hypothetical protein
MEGQSRDRIRTAGYAPSPEAFELGHLARHYNVEDHMQNAGTSAPVGMAHGYGRRHITPEDHQVTSYDYIEPEAERLKHGSGRKLIVPYDHMKCDVLKPIEEIENVKVPSRQDMKEAIKDWLLTVHNMFIFNEAKWENEVNVEPKGCHWVIEALDQQKNSIAREGPTARFIAEKLSMVPQNELRQFGVRYAGRNDPAPIRREKHGTFENNRSLVSPGVQDALDVNGKPGVQTMSSLRKAPEAIQRRYISSGKDHWMHSTVGPADAPGSHGHSKDDDFSDGGLERGMGHGKRYIGTQDHIYGGATL